MNGRTGRMIVLSASFLIVSVKALCSGEVGILDIEVDSALKEE